MSDDRMTCPLCGSTFQPSGEEACAACPLHSGCGMVCCPTCGYTSIAPGRSRLARAVARWLGAIRRPGPDRTAARSRQTLADVPIGAEASIVALGALAPEHQDWLHAYGVQPGHSVRVLQQRPVTIVQVEQAELSFEAAVAREVEVLVRGGGVGDAVLQGAAGDDAAEVSA